MESVKDLRFVTYLAPSLPEDLFAAISEYVGRAVGLPVSLRCETRTSGPPPDEVDPFSSGATDIGFMCAPSYLWLSELRPPAVRLLPAAPVFDDPRAEGRPVYFSDVIVGRDSRAAGFDDLRRGTFAINDRSSLSGYLALLRRLRAAGGPFVEALRESGSHLESIRLVAAGEVDGAVIDSNALALALRRDGDLGRHIRVLESWGPHPIQPVVVSARLPDEISGRIAAALLRLHEDEAARRSVAPHGLARFAPVSDADYEHERAALTTST